MNSRSSTSKKVSEIIILPIVTSESLVSFLAYILVSLANLQYILMWEMGREMIGQKFCSYFLLEMTLVMIACRVYTTMTTYTPKEDAGDVFPILDPDSEWVASLIDTLVGN